jgi:hypothetical protein
MTIEDIVTKIESAWAITPSVSALASALPVVPVVLVASAAPSLERVGLWFIA